MANFHFSHYKSTETLICHSHKSTRATSTRNVTFVEANVMKHFCKVSASLPSYFEKENTKNSVREVTNFAKGGN